MTGTERSGTQAKDRWQAAVRRGETWALEQFYAEHQTAIYRLCCRLLPRAEDAEDAMQATFTHAFRALPRFRFDCAPRTWLYRIAVNEANTLLRRRPSEPLPDNDLPAAETPLSAAERLEIQAALTRLAPPTRLILVLRFWEELSYGEIAVVLAITLPAVKMRLKRAREQFRRVYEETE